MRKDDHKESDRWLELLLGVASDEEAKQKMRDATNLRENIRRQQGEAESRVSDDHLEKSKARLLAEAHRRGLLGKKAGFKTRHVFYAVASSIVLSVVGIQAFNYLDPPDPDTPGVVRGSIKRTTIEYANPTALGRDIQRRLSATGVDAAYTTTKDGIVVITFTVPSDVAADAVATALLPATIDLTSGNRHRLEISAPK